MIQVNLEQLADIVTRGDLVMDVNIEIEYKGFTIIVDCVNGENPFGEPQCDKNGEYKKVCIVPDGEYKWINTFWYISQAKTFIDSCRWDS